MVSAMTANSGATGAAITNANVRAGERRLLAETVELYVAADDSTRRERFRALVAACKDAAASTRFDELAVALKSALACSPDYTGSQALFRLFKLLPPEMRGSTRLRLAVLGGFTTHQLGELVELYLFAAGVNVEIYESDYGIFRQEILDSESGVYSFKPDRIFLAANWRNLGHVPSISSSREEVRSLVGAEFGDWERLWQLAHDRSGCQILQNNFDSPHWRALGNFELRHPASLHRYIHELNSVLADRAPAYVTIHDTDGLSAEVGRLAWGDERFFLHAKMPCAPEYLAEYARSVTSVIAAELGRSKKCLVLDLDNTLWGGVIGDDGIGGIRVGNGDAEGEGFLSFQRYAKALQARGVILAVCSKNDEKVAKDVFLKHPDMVLRLEDISCFVANWNDKAANLRIIAKQLNIGLESLVFVDDNPAERSIVRQLVPEVSVPEVSTDPVDFMEALERHRYFQVASLGSEDLKRTEYYRANRIRSELAAGSIGVDQFLASLDMVANIGPIVPATLERSVQLINKSNQFNLTTQRRTVAEMKSLVDSAGWVTVTASLSDRFGDNGLVSVVLGEIQRDALFLDTWLMSCRVLKRGLEQAVLNYLSDLAVRRGLELIRGVYIATAKNELVRNHYADLGFRKVGDEKDGRTSWELQLAGLERLKCHIKVRSE